MNKDIILAIIKSPLCLAITSFIFAMMILNSVVVPIVRVVTDTLPGQMTVIISELHEMRQSCLGDKVASRQVDREAQ